MRQLWRTLFLVAVLAGSASASKVEIQLQPSGLLMRGNEYLERGEIVKAKTMFERALRSDLTNRQRANAHNGMCVAHLREEAWVDAMTQCDRAIKLIPVNWRFYNNRGNVHFGLGQWHEAMDDYAQGLRLAPKSITLAKNIDLAKRRARLRGVTLRGPGDAS